MSSQSHITQVFQQFCKKVSLHVHQIDVSTYVANVSGAVGKWPIFCFVKRTRLSFSSILPVTVPAEKRPPVMEYVTRANWGLPIGTFEMDLDDGEVHFTTSIEVADGKLTTTMVGVLFATHFSTVDRYLPGVLSVLFANQHPATAILSCEAESEDAAEPDDLNELLKDVDVDRLPEPGDD